MPSAAPMIAASDSGESITLSGPYLSNSFSVARNTPPRLPTSSPMTTTRSSRAISLSRVVAMAWAIVCRLMVSWPPDRARSPLALPALLREALRHLGGDGREHPPGRRGAGGLGLGARGVQLRRGFRARLLLVGAGPQPAPLEEAAEARQRVAPPPRLDLLARPVARGVVGGRVPAVAVDEQLHERRADALAGALHDLASHVVRGQHGHPGHQVARHHL